LPTQVRLASWGLDISTSCSLSYSYDKDRSYLPPVLGMNKFGLWFSTGSGAGCHRHSFHTWSTALIAWLSIKVPVSLITLKRLAVHATIYSIYSVWRIHDYKLSPTSQIFKSIDRCMRDVVLGQRHNKKFHDTMRL
ncbi:hypothetical protein HID58_020628, partial [Brassica napus]